MKKTIVLMIHVLSVLLFAAGLSVVYMLSPGGFGLSWINESDFISSPQFAEMVNEDIGNIKEYAILKDTFEENGEIVYDKTIVTAETSNGLTAYTLREMSNIAAGYGCTMDPQTHRISITDSGSGEEDSAVNYQLKIAVKYYDPDYYADRPQGPGQGIMNLKDLSIEVMQVFARYYVLDEEYGHGSTNFCYSLHYLNAQDEYIDVYNTEKPMDDLLGYPRYLRVEGSGQSSIDTNISPVPSNAYESENSPAQTDPFGREDEYELVVGIDTTFPYQDRYSRAADAYSRDIDNVYAGIFAMAAGGILGIISLIMLLYSGSTEKGIVALKPADGMDLELYIIMIAAAGVLLYWIGGGAFSAVVSILAPSDSREYFISLGRALVIYGLVVCVLRSMIRRYNGGVLWKNTLLRKTCDAIEDFSAHGRLAAVLTSRYFSLVVLNVGLGTAAMYCFDMRFESWRYMIFMCGFLVLLLIIDLVVFMRIYRQDRQREDIGTALKAISEGGTETEISEEDFSGRELEVVKDINNISQGLRKALNEQVKAERLRADLITNVSHDIRTPLTSIINYVDLIKRENIQNQKVRDYVDILDKKSERLKNLTEDLLEASKASSGNVKLDMQKIDLVELAMQAGAEFEDKFAVRELELCLDTPETPVYILADGRHLWRVLENLYNNAAKYAMEKTRIYADVIAGEEENIFTIKNISREKLNISPDELTERFVRGDESRHTEGSGLGLSIAKSLTNLMGGKLEIVIDGDLYKANIHFPVYDEAMEAAASGEAASSDSGASLIEIVSSQD